MNKVKIYEAILDIAKRLLKDRIGTMDNTAMVEFSQVIIEINSLLERAKGNSYAVSDNTQENYLPTYQQ